MDFHSLKSPFLDLIVIQTGYWPDSNLGSVFIIKITFIMKNVNDFRKTVETGVDPRLYSLVVIQRCVCLKTVFRFDLEY